MGKQAKRRKPNLFNGPSAGVTGRWWKRMWPSRRSPPVTIEEILAWADAHRKRTGKWPNKSSGKVHEDLSENWSALDASLYQGHRGLPGGSSLARLLAEQRGVRNLHTLPPLTVELILAWADAHRDRAGKWPRKDSGKIHEEESETWSAVNAALREGSRGLACRSSLAMLLQEYRGVRNIGALPPLSVQQILGWADAYHEEHGTWPTEDVGPITGTLGETWIGVTQALRLGSRGLQQGSSLVKLLAEHRGIRNPGELPHLSIEQILAWADAHRERTRLWPTTKSGPVLDAPGETWAGINWALGKGARGLPGGSSVSRLLEAHRDMPQRFRRHPLTVEMILAWADEYHGRTGEWPSRNSGRVEGEPLNWLLIDKALGEGNRGLPGGSSVARLLAEHRGIRNPHSPPPLSIEQILAWADEHHRHTGAWPKGDSGPIRTAPDETWRAVEAALRYGWRGFPGGSSLVRLLAEQHATRRESAKRPCLSVEQILAWADAHYQRSGRWPNERSGPVYHAPGETWADLSAALRAGARGLPGGSCLVDLLVKHRGSPRSRRSPPLTIEQVLTWADQYHARTGKWPHSKSGVADKRSGVTWAAIENALYSGLRGLPGNSSLHKLLVAKRCASRKHSLPRRATTLGNLRKRPLEISQIFTWARSYREWTGKWPTAESGAVGGKLWESWKNIDQALRDGHRGLPGGSSLAQLLAEHFGVRNIGCLPSCTIEKILEWADEHYQRTGNWPTKKSGIIPDSGDEEWSCVDAALNLGGRGFSGGSSLAKLLAQHRGVRNRKGLPPFTEEQILTWVDAHRLRTGDWPSGESGSIPDAPGESWNAVNQALQTGIRGLPGGSSLAFLLAEKRGVQNIWSRANLTIPQILAWADAHRERTGRWPNLNTGSIPEAAGENWNRVDHALKRGSRGLAGGTTLSELLAVERDVRNRASLPRLSRKRILAWAIAHHKRTGKWPTADSGSIPECPGETWQTVESALRSGYRGLRGGSSLARLLDSHGVKRNIQTLPPLSQKKILGWADAHHTSTGQWPTARSGPVRSAAGERWNLIDSALRRGLRGLPGGSSLIRLLVKKRGARHRSRQPPISV